MRRVSSTAFAHVGLNCRDMRTTERFYVRHFGFRRARVVPLGKGSRIVFLKSRTAYLELFQAKGRAKAAAKDGPPEAGYRHMAFRVSSVDGKIREMGRDARVTLGPFSFDSFIKGWRGAWLRDPDGRIIELSQGYRDETR